MHRFETEIKLPAPHRKQLEKRLAQLGFKVLKRRHFESNCLFDFPDLRLSRARCLLRLRRADGEDLLTFKGPPLRARRYGRRREVETRVEDGFLLREVLEKLGLKPVFAYEKYRTVYVESKKAGFPGRPHAQSKGGPRARPEAQAGQAEHGQPQVAYDETPVGNYLELEGPEKWIDEVARGLEYSPRDYITSTYLALYLRKCREEGKKPGNMVFKGRKSRLGLLAA